MVNSLYIDGSDFNVTFIEIFSFEKSGSIQSELPENFPSEGVKMISAVSSVVAI
jgi:hypothetical protein